GGGGGAGGKPERGSDAVHGDEAELPCGGSVAAPGDQNRAEPRDARVASAPDLEGLERVNGPAGAVVGQRAVVADGGAFALPERPRVAGGARIREERAVRVLVAREAPLEIVQQNRRPSGPHGELVPPRAQRDAEPEVRGRDRVRALARDERRRRRDADHDRIERLARARSP